MRPSWWESSGDFGFQYDYEIEYEYDFQNQEHLLKIIT